MTGYEKSPDYGGGGGYRWWQVAILVALCGGVFFWLQIAG